MTTDQLRARMEAILAGELYQVGFSAEQVQSTLTNLRRTVDAIPSRIRALGMFVKFVAIVDVLDAPRDPPPSDLDLEWAQAQRDWFSASSCSQLVRSSIYLAWRVEVDRFFQSDPPLEDLDPKIEQLLAAHAAMTVRH
jgi:hypothetical protein